MEESPRPIAYLLGWGFLLSSFLLVAIQPGATTDLRYHWATGSLILGSGALWALVAPWPSLRNAFFTLWTLVFGVSSLYATWISGHSAHSFIAGLFPYSDAFGYLSDAERILLGESISDFSARRPVFAATLACILYIVGNNLPAALLLLTLSVSLASAHAALTVGANGYGKSGAVLMLVFTWIFYRRYVGTTLTEHVGLGVGLLAFACLLRGASNRSEQETLAGVALLSVALVARAGTFFVLPALALWCGWFFKKEGKLFDWRVTVAALTAVLVVFLGNRLLLGILGGSEIASFSNFSYTLYGLVFGGDWTLALSQHPELSTLSANAQAEEVYRLAIERILASPPSLMFGAARAWVAFLFSAYGYGADFHPYASAFMGALILSIGSTMGLAQIFLNRRRPPCSMLLWILPGFLLSVPFVAPWDADLMRAYAATLPFTTILPAIGFSHAIQQVLRQPIDPTLSHHSYLPWKPTLIVVGALLFGLPLAARESQPLLPPPTHSCASGELPASVRAIPGTEKTIVTGEPNLDKTFIKAALRNPVQFLPEIAERSWDFQNSRLPLSRLQVFAATGHAPTEVLAFIRSLRVGDRLLLAQMRGKDNLATTILAKIEETLAFPLKEPIALCLVPAPWWTAAYLLRGIPPGAADAPL